MTEPHDAMTAAQYSMQEAIWNQHQANALAQQRAAMRFPGAGLGSLGHSFGLFGSGLVPPAPPPPPFPHSDLAALRAKKKPAARIGKITPKPGYIRDSSHPDGVRAEGFRDCSLGKRLFVYALFVLMAVVALKGFI